MTGAASPFHLRPMTVADLPQIHEIESQSFPSAWPSSAYKRELQRNNLAQYIVAARPAPAAAVERSRIGRVLSGLRGMLTAEPGAGTRPAPPADDPPVMEYLAGFLGLWMMVDEAHIVTVAVRESERRKGVGELLLLGAYDLAESKGLHVLTLECRVSNVAAQALYEKYGFQRVGIRPRYYTDNNEDALIMTTPSTEDPAYRARIEELRRCHQERWGGPMVEA
jgi:ribosomal-protein-alanine N-acetyltransferase